MSDMSWPHDVAASLRRAAALGAALALLGAGPAAGQLVIGGEDDSGQEPSVSVNEEVLDRLGPPAGSPPPDDMPGPPLMLTPPTPPAERASGGEAQPPRPAGPPPEVESAAVGRAPVLPPLPERKPSGPPDRPELAETPDSPGDADGQGPGLSMPDIPTRPDVGPMPAGEPPSGEPAEPDADGPQTAGRPPEPELALTPLPPEPDDAPATEPATAPDTPPVPEPPALDEPEVDEPADAAAPEAPQLAVAPPGGTDGDGGAAGATDAGDTDATDDAAAEPLTAMSMPVLGAAPGLPAPEERLSIAFDPEATDLPGDAGAVLGNLADRLRADDSLRLQLFSYAGSTAASAAEARTLSLHRALAVRQFMLDRDIRVTRIDIRALGNSAPEGPADRIDLVLVN
jgi:outer membrane protein OmpA-like peptidoglycan-associated protein